MLIDRVNLLDAVQEWGPTGNLAVLAAGEIPPNPSELLASEAMRATLRELAEHAVVLIDAPPLLPVTDAAILTARTDGAIVVAFAGRTRTDALEQALEHLANVNGRPLGLVLNGVPRRGADADAYSNRYGEYYRASADATPTLAPTAAASATAADQPESRRPRRRSSTSKASTS